MLCRESRELVSARLDGEDVPAAELDAHLAACADCRTWADDAARVTRLVRVRLAEPETAPDLVAAVVAVAPRTAGLRLALGGVGLGQCALAVSGILDAGGAHAAHLSHESAAWNLALGVGFGWVASGPARRVPGLVAMVGAFVGVLAVLSVLDLVGGQVDPVRLATHALVAVGFVLLLALARAERGPGGSRGATEDGATEDAVPAPAARRRPPRRGSGDGLASSARAAA